MQNMSLKMVIAVRQDIQMNKGKTAAQVAHAAVGCLADVKTRHPIVDRWLSTGEAKIVVKATDLQQIYDLADLCQAQGLMYNTVTDSGKTVFHQPTVTCIAIGPDTVEQVDLVTKGLKLL
jgi:PTH2 family peptidyl-tRNA hydrolase